MADRFQEWVEKEKNREELVQAMHSNLVFDYWRQILTVVIAALIIGGVFATRSKRFKQVLTKLESTPVLNKKRPKYLPPARIADPDLAMQRIEKVWIAQEAQTRLRMEAAKAAGAAPVAPGAEDEEFQAQMAADQDKRRALAGRLERISQGDVEEALKTPPPEDFGRSLSAFASSYAGAAGATAPLPEEEIIPLPVRPDTIGIAIGEPEPKREASALETGAHASSYSAITRIPSAYANEREEFPDLH
jgi:hypothetical protein